VEAVSGDGHQGLSAAVGLLLAAGLPATLALLGAPRAAVAGAAALGLLLGLLVQARAVRRARAEHCALAAELERLGPSGGGAAGGAGEGPRATVSQLTARLRAVREQAAQQEQLLRTVVESAPMALVLYADSGRILLANGAARQLFFEGADVAGRNFLGMLGDAPAPLREALLAEGDGLFTVEGRGEPETYHLARRDFTLAGEPHTLLLVKHLTRELSRQEVDVWKKVIRVMSHELNNSVAPILSLLHSARLIAQAPAQLPKLPRVLDTVEERARHLQSFLQGYARLARLPRPVPAPVDWARLLASLQALHPHARFGPPPASPGWFDAAQVEQALINVLKNAHEAGGPPGDVELTVAEADGGFLVQVHDRGQGLGPEAQASALLPFYTTKEGGAGLGLALSRDILEAHRGTLRIENRPGGGATVTLWLPGPSRARAADTASRARLTLTRT
jgi:signal transduction histidine kinase